MVMVKYFGFADILQNYGAGLKNMIYNLL